jgi:ABC-type branched-subunit amino acid transport system permease subunit
MMLLGVVFVVIVIFMPEGLVPGLARLRRRRAGVPGSRTEGA